MKPFETLSAVGQLRRMRQLAQAALRAYDLGAVRLTPLTNSENMTFRVETEPAVAQGNGAIRQPGRYVLRIHRVDAKSPAEISSELMWLAALRRETELVVPEPVLTSDRSLLTLATAEGVPGPRCCVLFRWVEGQFLGQRVSAAALGQVGVFMARLHQHAERFVPPATFTRGRVDCRHILDEPLLDHLSRQAAGISADTRRVLQLVAERIRSDTQSLGSDPTVYGLIHADLHQFNYLFHRGEVRAIDFDDCCWSHHLYDMAVTLVGAGEWQPTPAHRAAFLAGYRCVRPLAAAHEALLETFMAARRLIVLQWLLVNMNQPSFCAWAPAEAERAVRELRAFLD
jgi:Ser/Thr protein kinase RdoA (MazF antagonist)